jgi:hypothetical protein
VLHTDAAVQEQAHHSFKSSIVILNTSIFSFFDACLHDTILQTMPRNLFSEHIVPLSRTYSTPRFKRWRMIAGNYSLLSAILFSTTTFLRMGRKMCFDGKLALHYVSSNKSSNHIPVAVRSAVGLLYSREITKGEAREKLSRAKVPAEAQRSKSGVEEMTEVL